MSFLIKMFGATLKKYIKRKAIEKGVETISGGEGGGSGGGILFAIIGTILFIFLAFIATTSSFLCSLPFADCKNEQAGQYEVITFDDRTKIASRIDKLRDDTNNDADVKGIGFSDYRLNEKYSKEGDITLRKEEKLAITDQFKANSEYVKADPNEFLTGDVEGLNQGFAERLAGYAQIMNKGKISITSGMRTIEEQKDLYNKYLNGTGNLAAKPGYSR